MTLSIIIVNWNSQAYVRQCVASLLRHRPQADFEVIVVDNASFDGCAEMLRREFPAVAYVQSDQNVGFAKANNLGARQASGRNLLFLNPDTELLEDSLGVLLRGLAELPAAGAVGCVLLNTDRSLQTSCVQSFPTVINQALDSEFLRRRFPRSRLWGMAALYATNPRPAEVEAISGAAILVTRDVFAAVGGFSENYFMYGEDLDLCFKIKQAGYRIYHLAETRIVHHGGGSTKAGGASASNVMMRESVFRFMRRHRGPVRAALYRAAMAATSLGRIALSLPLLVAARGPAVPRARGSIQKWKAILRWSFGLEAGIRRSP